MGGILNLCAKKGEDFMDNHVVQPTLSGLTTSQSSTLFNSRLFFQMMSMSQGENFVYSPHQVFALLLLLISGSENETQRCISRGTFTNVSEAKKRIWELEKRLGLEEERRKFYLVSGIFTPSSVSMKSAFSAYCTKSHDVGVFQQLTFPKPGKKRISTYFQRKTNKEVRGVGNSIDVARHGATIIALSCFIPKFFVPFPSSSIYPDYFSHYGEKVIQDVKYMCVSGTLENYGEHCIRDISFYSLTRELKQEGLLLVFLKLRKNTRVEYENFEKLVLFPSKEDFDVENQGILSNIVRNQRKLKMKIISIPKMNMKVDFKMKEALSDGGLGMAQMFDRNSAQFPGCSQQDDFHIGQFYHLSAVSFESKGLKFSQLFGYNMPKRGIEFVLNQPFYFFVVHREALSAPLLVGKVADPTERQLNDFM